jgi:hypothetical protein
VVRFRPDIIVTDRDLPDVRLVVEIKKSIPNWESAENQLRRYMLARSSSLGMLVTPLETRIYRDMFADFTDRSIELVANLSTRQLLNVDRVPTDELMLRSEVADWLERLTSAWSSALPSDEAARETFLKHLVPEVANGLVSSGTLA